MFTRIRLSALLLAVFVGVSFTNISAFSTQADGPSAAVSNTAGNENPGKIILSRHELSMAAGQTVQLKAVMQTNGKTVQGDTKFLWISDKPNSVKVDSKGNITAAKPGSKAVITAKSPDGKVKAYCYVTVIPAKEAENCVAIIGNTAISIPEYTMFTKFNMNTLLAQNPDFSAGKVDWSSQFEGLPLKEQVQKQVLEKIQEFKIQYKKALEAGIKFDADDQKMMDSQIQQLIDGAGGLEPAEKEVRLAYGLSLEEYKQVCKDLILMQKYIEAEYNKIEVSEKETEDYYNTHKADYDSVTVTHILISTVSEDGGQISSQEKLAAGKKAEELLAKVKAGEDIKKLAEEYSDDPGVKENGGQYTFGKGEMVEPFENWAFTHSPGDIGIVETNYGYHVLKMDNREEVSFEALRDLVKSTLINTRFNEGYLQNLASWKREPQYEIIVNKSIMDELDKTLYEK